MRSNHFEPLIQYDGSNGQRADIISGSRVPALVHAGRSCAVSAANGPTRALVSPRNPEVAGWPRIDEAAKSQSRSQGKRRCGVIAAQYRHRPDEEHLTRPFWRSRSGYAEQGVLGRRLVGRGERHLFRTAHFGRMKWPARRSRPDTGARHSTVALRRGHLFFLVVRRARVS